MVLTDCLNSVGGLQQALEWHQMTECVTLGLSGSDAQIDTLVVFVFFHAAKPTAVVNVS